MSGIRGSGGILQLGLLKSIDLLSGTLMDFSLILLLTTLAMISPYPLFEKKIGINRSWILLSLLSFVGEILFLLSTVHSILIVVGLYGEVFLIAALFYAAMSVLPGTKNEL